MTSNYSKRDAYFRSMLGFPDIMRDFVIHRLPRMFLEGFELERVELLPTSVLKTTLTNSVMDVVLKLISAQQELRYVIVEHQSRAQRLMPIRLSMYQTDLLREHLKSSPKLGQSNRYMPLILACVYYTGQRQPYPYSMNIRDLFQPCAIGDAMDGYTYPLINVVDLPTDDTYKNTQLFFVEGVLRYTSQKQYQLLANHIAGFRHLDDTPVDMRRLTWQYILSDTDRDQMRIFLDKLSEQLPMAKGEIMSYAESLILEGLERGRIEGQELGLLKGKELGLLEGKEQGRAEGKAEGKELGSLEARTDIAKQLLASGTDLDLIAKCTGFTKEQLLAMQDQN